jgi:hypothetical protein
VILKLLVALVVMQQQPMILVEVEEVLVDLMELVEQVLMGQQQLGELEEQETMALEEPVEPVVMD